ncbi:lysylphosphatidylglycerol synthase domain-containing protein [Edaphobacter modestus]|uniref:Lysylphosphatidylglycerol synthase-like protein n=1 Tax=Edaphobacter modestus TaxID=388466 RepID=A0A4Q7YGT0_9BACT|nr:lysylphosphatidylglycerol synthase domain-containing protein [Edaphobacter modestus]RZU35549.1 lysylphosphatidylglycerol synthase-like protein [Edaphobacter modestus]
MKRIQLIIAFAALALFAWAIAHLGLATIVAQLKAMRVALPIVMALSALRLFLQSTTWSASLKGGNVAVNTRTLIGVRLASQSMGYLTVLGPVISEPMKIKLLGTAGEPTIAATFLDTGVYWFTSALVVISGVVCLPIIAGRGAAYHWAPGVLALAFAVFAITRRSPILAGVARALGSRAPSWLSRAEQFERSIRTYRLQQPALVSRMFWIGATCQLLIASEVLVVLWALHLPIHFFAVMAIEGVTRSLKLASGWVPARVGFDEGGAISAFAVAGLSPMNGLGLALTRRVRDLLWALMGIIWLAWNTRGLRPRHAITFEHSSNSFERGI